MMLALIAIKVLNFSHNPHHYQGGTALKSGRMGRKSPVSEIYH
jgi:hypothetical protein